MAFGAFGLCGLVITKNVIVGLSKAVDESELSDPASEHAASSTGVLSSCLWLACSLMKGE